jgi:hypothetical protein
VNKGRAAPSDNPTIVVSLDTPRVAKLQGVL